MAADHSFLLEQIAAGDKAAYTAFYRELEKPVFRFIRSKLNDQHEASDILHEVFMEVWRSAGKFEGRSSVKTWLFGIAYRKTMDAFRKKGRLDLMSEPPEQADEGPDAAACLAASQEAAHVRACLEGAEATASRGGSDGLLRRYDLRSDRRSAGGCRKARSRPGYFTPRNCCSTVFRAASEGLRNG